ncbi:MAG: hypothetical protein Q7U04_17310, partial [Bacteriovorax sp.]|nr:hypothetical protein [Bacteriovorax sp.]
RQGLTYTSFVKINEAKLRPKIKSNEYIALAIAAALFSAKGPIIDSNEMSKSADVWSSLNGFRNI